MPEPPKSTRPAQTLKAVSLCFGFGVSLAAEIYVVGILVGGWLDKKLNSAPWCMLAGTLLAIAAAFWQLLRGLDLWNKRNSDKPADGEDKQA